VYANFNFYLLQIENKGALLGPGLCFSDFPQLRCFVYYNIIAILQGQYTFWKWCFKGKLISGMNISYAGSAFVAFKAKLSENI